MTKLIYQTATSVMTHNTLTLLVDVERELVHQLVSWVAMRNDLLVIDCACTFDANRVQELIPS